MMMTYSVAKLSCALLLLALPACVANNPFAANNRRSGIQRKRDVTLTISASKSSFAANEPVLIDFTLRNNDPKKSARILDWDIPCDTEDGLSSPEDSVTEMSFFKIATSGGQVAKYLGALLKRSSPSEGNYKRLKPGDEVSCSIDLGQYFEFNSSDGDDDDYIIQYSVTSMELSKPTAVNTTNTLEILESNTLIITIGDRANHYQSNRRDERNLQTALNTFRRCSTAQQVLIAEARTHAITASNDAVAIIESVGLLQSTSTCLRYKQWFGDYSLSRHTELKTGYMTSRDRLISAFITFDCGCTGTYYAYVYPSDPYKIYFCKAFWNAPMTGTDSKMGTIIHEMTHFTITADTDDNAYGQTDCKALAISNSAKAVNNADSHEYAAENTPVLSCIASSPKPSTVKPTTSKPSTSLPTSLKPTSNPSPGVTVRPTSTSAPAVATPTNSPTTTFPTTTMPTTTKPTAGTCRAKTQSCKKKRCSLVGCGGSLTCCCCAGLRCINVFNGFGTCK